jgi:hypothetical protein
MINKEVDMKRDNSRRDEAMKVEFVFRKESDGEFLHVKLATEVWNDPKGVGIIALLGQCIMKSVHPNICFDFAGLPLIHSMLLGECANIIKLAQDNKKKIKMRFNKESAELVRATRLDKLVKIEEVD